MPDCQQSTIGRIFEGELALSGVSEATDGIGPLPKATLRAHIVERLRAAILAGDIAPGTPITETALSARFDVSRGPLREALRQLIEEGLLVTVPYTGTHVASLSLEDVQEIYSLRTALEIFAFEQVWDRRDDRFRTELHRSASTPATTAPASSPSSNCTGWSTKPAGTGCCSVPGTACAAACNFIGPRTTAPMAGADLGATATTATSRRRWATISTRSGLRSPTTCAAGRR